MKKIILLIISIIAISGVYAYDLTSYYETYADEVAANYQGFGIRVHNDTDVMNAIDDIVNNFKIGEYHLVFSKNDTIHKDKINAFLKGRYAVVNTKQNYYNYKLKGNIDPLRFYSFLDDITNNEIIFDTNDFIRLTKEEYKQTDYFVNKILPYLTGDGSDYDKIAYSFKYIKETTPYITDNGFINDLVATNTSIYDVFMNRKSVCIGYSVAFSYLMDKFGIESYIIDNLTVQESEKTFYSTHTYNVVKIDNKFYKIDITSGEFLVPLGNNVLYDKKLNLATSRYNSNKSVSIDYNAINSIYNEVKSMNFKEQNKDNNNNNKRTTTTKEIITNNKNNKTTTTVTNSEGEKEVESITTNIYDVSENTHESNIIKENNINKKKFDLNYVLIPIVIFTLIILLIYEIKFKK